MATARTSSTNHKKRTPTQKSLNALTKINEERQREAAARTKPAKSYRNTGKEWEAEDVKMLGELAKQNTPTRVIGLKLGRTEASIRDKAKIESISLKPANRSPYNRSASSKARH